MEAVGERCDVHIYEGQGHGFFNQDRSATSYAATVAEMDGFLASLGWL
jgi:dienelactone hydrolase